MNNANIFEQHLAAPLIIHADMDESAFRCEFARMQVRAAATADFVAGELDLDDYLDTIEDSGVDIDDALETWNSGQSYMS